MSRALSVWLLASALCAFVGCGGGAATDSGAVAENSGGAAPASGSVAPMPSSGDAAMSPSGDAMGASSGGMESGMNPEMYGNAGTGAEDPAAMAMPGMVPGGEGYPGNTAPSGDDAAAMAAAYGAGAEGGSAGPADAAPDTSTGAGLEAMPAGYPGAGAEAAGLEGAYSGVPGGPGGAVEEKVPDGFDGKAQLAFRRGKEKDALQYLYAHALTTDAGAESLLPTMRWVGGLRQPMLAVRWGVGFVVTAPRNFTGDPKPVGSQQNIPTRADAKRGGGGNEGYVGAAGTGESGGGDGGGGKNSLLAKGAGELGEKLMAAYTERLLRGDFGEVLKQAADAGITGKQGHAGGAGAYGYGGAGEAGGADSSLGPMGAGGLGGAAAAADATTEVTQITPGLSMLGIGTQKELIDRARQDGIDAVVVIDVTLRVSPANGLVTNESTIAVFDAKTQKKFHTTKKFNNITIQQARADDKEDGVDKEFEALFEAIDANLKMADLPAGLNADIATKRVAALAAEKHDNPLPILVEARMYHSKGLLDEAQLFAAYESLLGVDRGRLLATGAEEDKKKVLDQWLPAS